MVRSGESEGIVSNRSRTGPLLSLDMIVELKDAQLKDAQAGREIITNYNWSQPTKMSITYSAGYKKAKQNT